MHWVSTLLLSALQGSTFGFMFGCICDDIDSAANIMTSFTSMVIYGCGVYVNLKTGPWYIKALGYISPFRYLIEKLMRTLLKGLDYEDSICENYDWNYKQKVIPISLLFFIIFFFLSWVSIVLKAK